MRSHSAIRVALLSKVQKVLELQALSKHFPTHRAVDGVSFTIYSGEFFSLVGPSGCGKTTTLRLIAGFEEPTSGRLLLDGESVEGLPAYKRNVSTVFQNYALFPHLTVAQNVAFGLERRGKDNKQAVGEKVGKALALVHLDGKETRLPNQISGGERQRVALARSLVLEPKVLLLDEPLSALDAKLRKEMRQELKNLQRRTGVAFLFVTHDQEEALSLSDRVAIMNRGVLEQLGTPREVYRSPKTRFVAEFLGDVNWIDGAGVRPEALRVSRTTAPGVERCVSAIVEGQVFLGNCIHLSSRLENGSICVAEMAQQDCDFEPGEPVYLCWHGQDEFCAP
jgi:spermidine/putrescine transport system ATP-binding protein